MLFPTDDSENHRTDAPGASSDESMDIQVSTGKLDVRADFGIFDLKTRTMVWLASGRARLRERDTRPVDEIATGRRGWPHALHGHGVGSDGKESCTPTAQVGRITPEGRSVFTRSASKRGRFQLVRSHLRPAPRHRPRSVI